MNRDRTRVNAQFAPRRLGGFTLLEMLLTTLLAATLMASVWSLTSLYIDLFESGRERTQEAQLVRSLMGQFGDDLRAAIQTPSDSSSSPTSAEPSLLDTATSAAASARPPHATGEGPSKSNQPFTIVFATATTAPSFGLVGTQTSLQLALLHASPTPIVDETSDENENAFRTQSIIRAPELRVVVYSFETPYEPAPNERRPPAGLLRREFAWETALALTGTAEDLLSSIDSNRNTATSTFSGRKPMIAANADGREQSPEGFNDESITLVPEVVAIEFRYFDGQMWNSAWDSRERKTLPVAIEVALQVMSSDELDDRGFSTVDEQNDRTDLLKRSTEMANEPENELGRIYRQLIHLPTAAPRSDVVDVLDSSGSTFFERSVRTRS